MWCILYVVQPIVMTTAHSRGRGHAFSCIRAVYTENTDRKPEVLREICKIGRVVKTLIGSAEN